MESTSQPWAGTEEDEEQIPDDGAHPFREGTEKATRFTESMASRTPTLLFLIGALLAVIASAILHWRGKRHASLFLGQWVPSLLMFGIYNKLSKTMGVD